MLDVVQRENQVHVHGGPRHSETVHRQSAHEEVTHEARIEGAEQVR
jgi:hypothetical protein